MDNIRRNAEGLRELALFAGAGGGILGGLLLGWRTVCAVEFNAYARSVLLARQNDGTLEPFPIWDDVRTFDGRPWCGIVDVVSGGFPCLDGCLSSAKAYLDGIADALGIDDSKFRPIMIDRQFGEARVIVTITAIETTQPQMEINHGNNT